MPLPYHIADNPERIAQRTAFWRDSFARSVAAENGAAIIENFYGGVDDAPWKLVMEFSRSFAGDHAAFGEIIKRLAALQNEIEFLGACTLATNPESRDIAVSSMASIKAQVEALYSRLWSFQR